MPYIKYTDRELLDTQIEILNAQLRMLNSKAGNLNYVITRLLDGHIQWNGRSYEEFNMLIGVLGCAKDEFYRRVVVPYEDKKCEENGDVFHG